jgi:hypothetical protein
MGEPALPFGPRDAVVVDRPSRHPGLRVTAVAFADRTPRIRAWLHTPDWERVVATGTGGSAGEAAVRAEDLLEAAWARGVPVARPRLRSVDAA